MNRKLSAEELAAYRRLLIRDEEYIETQEHSCAIDLLEHAEALEAELAEARAWRDADGLPEDDDIAAAFPTQSGRHDTYLRAMQLVQFRRSKGSIVALVNWLLVEAERARDAFKQEVKVTDGLLRAANEREVHAKALRAVVEEKVSRCDKCDRFELWWHPVQELSRCDEHHREYMAVYPKCSPFVRVPIADALRALEALDGKVGT